MAPPPLKEPQTPPSPSGADQDNLCSLMGTVTDSVGAAVEKATVIITNLDTKVIRTVTTNAAGQYVANDLPAGRYSVMAYVKGFKHATLTGIVLKAGDRKRTDIRLEISTMGCCEYAASPLTVEKDKSQKK